MISILIDLGGVVFSASGRESETIDWNIVLELNAKFDQLSLGRDTLENYLLEYNLRTKQALTPSEFLQNIWDTLDYNEELIRYLQKYDHIYILSDNYQENIEYINHRFNLKEWCDQQFYSYEFGMTKANPEIFLQVLQRIPQSANELIFIDDSDYKIKSAESVGIKSILYTDNERLFAALERS